MPAGRSFRFGTLVAVIERKSAMLRSAKEPDIPEIRRLIESEPGLWDASWTDETLHDALATPSGLAFVWEDGAAIVGFLCAHDTGFRGYLSMLVVAKEHRKQGVGRALIGRVEQELRSRGRQVLISDVWKSAVGFYATLGWGAPDVALMRKRLVSG